jgi:predicted PurR-regulated permease PerM
VALVALGALLIVLEARVLMVLLAGVLFALVLRALSLVVTKRVHVPYPAALAVIALVVVAVLGLSSYALGAGLLHQMQDLGKQLPQAWDSLLGSLHDKPGLAPLAERLQDGAAPAPGHAELAAGAAGVVEAFGGCIVVFFVGLYGAGQPDAYPRVALHLIPRRQRRRVRAALDRIGAELTRWLAGRAVAMAVVGVLVTVGLLLLKVPLAWALGALAALLTFVEYLGAFVSAAPAMLVAFTRGPTYAIWVAVLFTAAHILEGYVLTPLLVRTTVRFPPAYTLAAQAVLGAIYGVAGLTFATPIMIVGTVLVKKLYIDRREAREARRTAARDSSRGEPTAPRRAKAGANAPRTAQAR